MAFETDYFGVGVVVVGVGWFVCLVLVWLGFLVGWLFLVCLSFDISHWTFNPMT